MSNDLMNEICNCDIELKAIQEYVKHNPIDSKVKYLTNYAVVRVCSLLESILKQLICDYLSYNASDEAKQFLKNQIIESSTNPSTGNIERLFENFNGTKAELLKNNPTIKGLKSDINNLVELRNGISHGRSNATTITTVYRYFEASKKYINAVESVLTTYIS